MAFFIHGIFFRYPCLFYIFFILFFFSSCSFFHKDPVVLSINEKKWTSRLFSIRLAQKINDLNVQDVSDPAFMASLKKQLTGELLREYLVERWAKEHAVFVSSAEWAKALKKIQNSYTGENVFELYLKRKKTNKKAWESALKQQMLYEKVMHHMAVSVDQPSEKEARAYYRDHSPLFQKKASLLIYHVFHKQKTPLLKIKEELSKGKTLSSAVENIMGDSLFLQKQWVTKGVFKIFDQAFSLKKTEISPVWASLYGWHIVQARDKKPAQMMPYEEALPRIREQLMNQRRRAFFAEWLNTESQKVQVFTNKEALKKIKIKIHP